MDYRGAGTLDQMNSELALWEEWFLGSAGRGISNLCGKHGDLEHSQFLLDLNRNIIEIL